MRLIAPDIPDDPAGLPGWLDRHLEAVEAGRDPLQVRAEADETVNTLIKALRDRAMVVA